MNKKSGIPPWETDLLRNYESDIQNNWDSNKTYQIDLNQKHLKPFYCLVMFPYPSGQLHMGHVRNYTIGDVISRYKRLQKYTVFHPIGWDAFGLPAENAAIQNNIHPSEWTHKNIKTMKSELKSLGISYNWDVELATCDLEYYKWNQFFFLQMLKEKIAYKKTANVNWCTKCNTVLANEQVIDGYCWRHSDIQVQQKFLSQWFFKIKNKAEELLKGHEELKGYWPDKVLSMQKNWIGKSTGFQVDFMLKEFSYKDLENKESYIVSVFTTRLDTIFGVTYLAISLEHPLIHAIQDDKYKQLIDQLQKKYKSLNQQEREVIEEKEGCFTGLYVKHPINNKGIPIYAANFVLMQYGTGAVMSVPAHDERDYQFAKKYNLPIIEVIQAKENSHASNLQEEPIFTGYGILCNSSNYSNLESKIAIQEIGQNLKEEKLGTFHKNYKIRDWLISRQRYWGTPIPVIYCEHCGIQPVPEKDLPIILPKNIDFKDSNNILSSLDSFYKTLCPSCKKPAHRETDTMDTFVDSSWYFLRYLFTKDTNSSFQHTGNNFLPVDQYIGGIEHATMHLLYARYLTKVLYDLKLCNVKEPFKKLLTQGMVIKDGKKMSKSIGNIVTPQPLIEKYGADTVRLFIMFAAPVEKDLNWSDQGVAGCFRFLRRLYRWIQTYWETLSYHPSIEISTQDLEQLTPRVQQILRKTHQTISFVTHELETNGFNTAIAKIMELTNDFYLLFPIEDEKVALLNSSESSYLSFVTTSILVIIFPFTPHLSLYLLTSLGLEKEQDIQWPTTDPKLLTKSLITIVIQINGKVRSSIDFETNTSKIIILSTCKQNPKIQSYLKNKTIIKEIYIPNKLINFVIK